MKNKLTLALVIFLIIFGKLRSNDNLNEKFTVDLEAYIAAYNEQNWNKVADFLYPKLFTITPKKLLIESMSAQDDSGVTTKMTDIKVVKISQPISNQDEILYVLNYNLGMQIKLDSTLNSQKEFMKSMFISEYGKENVKHNKELTDFKIKSKLQMIAISTDNGNTFHYVENAKGNDELLKMIFEEKILKEIKKNKF